MKKLIIIFFAAVLAMTGSASMYAQGKYGADSAECIKYLSYYKEYFKQKNYADATPNWRKAFKYCPPTANQTMLVDGTALIRQLIAKNQSNFIYKEALIDTLMMIHNIRAQYYPKYATTALNNKGQDMIMYVKDDNRKLYEGFAEIVKTNGENTLPQIFLFQLNSAVALYKDGVLTAEDVINTYEAAMENIDAIEAKKPSESLSKIKADIENIFITSRVASCENLLALFTPRLEAAPDDLELAKNVVRMLSTSEDCTNNDLFMKAANAMHRLDPSATSAYFLYKLYASKGEIDTATKFIQQAIDSDETDADKDADYCFEAAALCFKNGKSATALSYALKSAALDTDGDVRGKAYMLAGTVWGSTVCKGNEIEVRAPYWVAVDYMQKAKAADASLASECNDMIAKYSAYFPNTGDAFMYGVTDGQTYEVSCNGLKATTTVRTQK